MVWMVGMADNDGTQGQNNKKKKRKRQANPDETGTEVLMHTFKTLISYTQENYILFRGKSCL